MVKKKITLSMILLIAISFLSGCASAQTEGAFFHDYLVRPFTILITVLGNTFNNNYGLAIILITIIVRTILLPIALNAAKKQMVMKEKMEVIKPEMDAIQKRLKAAKTKEEQAKIQQEMMQLYKEHNFNPFSMGCLPMLLQIPIWMGLYYAIRLSPEIGAHSFLWFNLGRPDIPMGIIAAILYYFQFKVSMMNVPEQQAQQMKMMGLMSPIMILIASLSTAAALALYWTFSALFLIGQTYLTKKLYGTAPTPTAATAAANSKGNQKQQNSKKGKH